MNRTEWLEARRQCLTGTDVAAVLGLHPRRGPWDVLEDKRGLAPEFADNERMEWGRRLEGVVIDAVCERLGCVNESFGFVHHGWMGGTPDAVLTFTDDVMAVLEVKTADRSQAHHWGADGDACADGTAPAHYRAQLLWYCRLVGVTRGYLAVLLGGNELRILCYDEDVSVADVVVDYCREWWLRHVVAGEPLDVDASPACRRLLSAEVREEPVELPEILAAEYECARKAVEAAEALKDLAYNRLVAALGGATRGTAGKYRISYTVTKGRASLDVDALRKAAPELVAAHTRTGAPSRRLTLKEETRG